jgi:hypothetical protein
MTWAIALTEPTFYSEAMLAQAVAEGTEHHQLREIGASVFQSAVRKVGQISAPARLPLNGF